MDLRTGAVVTAVAFGLTALAFATGAVAQAHMPTRDGRAHMPIEWLLSNGQPFFYKAFESSEARPILKREPTPDEAKAIAEIQRRFNTTSSVAVLLGDSEKIVLIAKVLPPKRPPTCGLAQLILWIY